MSNQPGSPPPPARSAPGRRVALAAAAMAVLAGLACCKPVLGTLEEVAVRLVGHGHLYWSDGASGWVEIPLSLRVRRHWGEADHVVRPRYRELAAGLELADLSLLRPPDPRAVEVVVVRVNPARWRFRVWGRDDWSRASVSTLAGEAGLVLAVNGPYFADGGPLGLVVSDGVVRNRQGTRRAAHFVVGEGEEAPRIVNEKRAQLGKLDQGFQGFPSIMSGGKTFAYMRTGGRGFDVDAIDRRTAACIDAEGSVLLLVTDVWTAGLSLADLATLLGTLGCTDAMAFDGGASTALSARVGDFALEVGGFDAVPVVVGIVER